MARPEYEGSKKCNFWAPEIMFLDEKFYLYYTADQEGDPYKRFIRVGVSEHPEGPYVDQGIWLTKEASIDGSPFIDSNGEIFFFYTGNEGSPFEGQLVMDTFINPLELSQNPEKVFPDENVEWEEGAFILKEKETYFLFSSQGDWRDSSYGIRIAESKSITGPWKRMEKDGEAFVLLSTDEQLNGPGHNSVFRNEAGKPFICFHSWNKEGTGRYPWLGELNL